MILTPIIEQVHIVFKNGTALIRNGDEIIDDDKEFIKVKYKGKMVVTVKRDLVSYLFIS